MVNTRPTSKKTLSQTERQQLAQSKNQRAVTFRTQSEVLSTKTAKKQPIGKQPRGKQLSLRPAKKINPYPAKEPRYRGKQFTKTPSEQKKATLEEKRRLRELKKTWTPDQLAQFKKEQRAAKYQREKDKVKEKYQAKKTQNRPIPPRELGGRKSLGVAGKANRKRLAMEEDQQPSKRRQEPTHAVHSELKQTAQKSAKELAHQLTLLNRTEPPSKSSDPEGFKKYEAARIARLRLEQKLEALDTYDRAYPGTRNCVKSIVNNTKLFPDRIKIVIKPPIDKKVNEINI